MDDQNTLKLTPHPDPRYPHRVLLYSLTVLLIIIIALSAGYLLGMKNVQSASQQQPATSYPISSIATPTPSIRSFTTQENCITSNQINTSILKSFPTSNRYMLYRNIVPDAGFQVYQTEIPISWSAYSVFANSVTTTYFGDAHVKDPDDPNVELDIPWYVYIVYGCNHALAIKDPSAWSFNDVSKYFEAAPLSNTDKYQSITVDGIAARKYTLPSQGDDSTDVYFTKGDMIFSIINYNGNGDPEYNHMLSTFKVLSVL